MTDQAQTRRAVTIIRDAGYLSLATTNADGRPWAAQLQYAWFTTPLCFVMESRHAARHSRDITETGRAAATISTLPGTEHGLDGIQVAGTCTALDGHDLRERAPGFYQQLFPDTGPDPYALQPEQLSGDAPLRLYQLRVDELWILDLDRWARDQVSTRVPVDMRGVATELAST